MVYENVLEAARFGLKSKKMESSMRMKGGVGKGGD